MYYVISDIHGCYKQMMDALSYWNSDKEHLVIIGDIINKGPNSLQVVRKLMELKESFPDKVTITRGNHESMFIEWFENNSYKITNEYPHKETIKSFAGKKRYEKMTPKESMEYVLTNNKEEFNFIKSFPLYYETEDLIFIHAGINLDIKDWKKDEKYMLWEKFDFIFTEKSPHKRVFFGHTPTNFIHNDNNNHDIWVSKDSMRIAIDGRVSTGGQLNTVKIDNIGNIVSTASFMRNSDKKD